MQNYLSSCLWEGTCAIWEEANSTYIEQIQTIVVWDHSVPSEPLCKLHHFPALCPMSLWQQQEFRSPEGNIHQSCLWEFEEPWDGCTVPLVCGWVPGTTDEQVFHGSCPPYSFSLSLHGPCRWAGEHVYTHGRLFPVGLTDGRESRMCRCAWCLQCCLFSSAVKKKISEP